MTTIAQTRTEAKGSFWGATFLVAGTCIGGGMLALPVQTAETGFVISALCILVSWMFMCLTGLLLVDATLWIKGEAHFCSLSRILVGHRAKVLAMVIYLFMNYLSLVAYTAGGATLIDEWTWRLSGYELGYGMSCSIFTLLFGAIVCLGTPIVSKINSLFMVFLLLAFLGLVAFGIGAIEPANLQFRPTWYQSMGIFPLLLATFSYQMVVPSVCSYLHYDAPQLRRAIILGTLISCVVYLVWICVIHGAVPLEGKDGLREAWEAGASATTPLGSRFSHWSLKVLADSFAFLAVVTSYFGLSLALFSFLKDGLKEVKIEISRSSILLLTFVPTLLLSMYNSRALLEFLDMSGGFGDTILSGLLPITMIWVGMRRGYLSKTLMFKKKWPLYPAYAFFLSVLIHEVIKVIF